MSLLGLAIERDGTHLISCRCEAVRVHLIPAYLQDPLLLLDGFACLMFCKMYTKKTCSYG